MKSFAFISGLVWSSSECTAFISISNPTHSSSRRRRLSGSSTFGAAKAVPSRTTALHVSTLVNSPDTYTSDPDRVKEELMHLIRTEPEDDLPNDDRFKELVSSLKDSYANTETDARQSAWPLTYNGEWQNEHSPAFGGRLGFNREGEPIYSFGSLTFYQFAPEINDLECSVQRMKQSAQRVGVTVSNQGGQPLFHPRCAESMIPSSMLEAVKADPSKLTSSVLETYFTTGNNVKGILRMQSYIFPHPTIPNRFDTWFVGGKCIPQANQDLEQWHETFCKKIVNDEASNTRSAPIFRPDCIVNSLAKSIKVLFGDKQTASHELSFSLPAPIMAFQDVVYLDEDLRITVGNKKTTIIFSRQCEPQ